MFNGILSCANFLCMAEAVKENDTINELEKPRWAVISFERCEGSGLTYQQAAQLLNKLDSQRVAGLAVVTDEAAAKISA